MKESSGAQKDPDSHTLMKTGVWLSIQPYTPAPQLSAWQPSDPYRLPLEAFVLLKATLTGQYH